MTTPAIAPDLATTQVLGQPISVGVPVGWVVLDQQSQYDLERQLRPIEPALADMYASGDIDWLSAVDIESLPGSFAGLRADWSCSDTPSAADRLLYLSAFPGVQYLGPFLGSTVEGSVIDLPAGEVAAISAEATVGQFTLSLRFYSYWAPTTDCDGVLQLMVVQSDPAPDLAESIARSVTLGARAGRVTLELRGAVVLAPTEFPVVCEASPDGPVRMSSGLSVEGMTTDLEVDAGGQPTFFQFANEALMYFSGKGFAAEDVFEPEAGSGPERGAATFEGITPPDDPAHPISGRVAWDCSP